VWLRAVVGSASAAVAASLLVVPTSVVSSSELVEAPAVETPPGESVDVAAADADPSSVTPRRDDSKIFGETLMRLQVNMGEDDPVVRGKVLVRSIEGKLLLRGYTNAVGQVVFLTQQEMPDRVAVRVKGGQSKGLKGDAIDLRAFFEPRDGEVVDVNPLTTMDELCRSGNYGTYCSTAVDSFYRLKGSVDYRDLVAISSRWFDGSRFGREASKRGLTTWQWAERVLLKAYAGGKAPKPKAERSNVTARSGASDGFIYGIMNSAGQAFAVKALVLLGLIPVGSDLESELRSIRGELLALSAGIQDILRNQAALTARVDELAKLSAQSSYRQLAATFDAPPRRETMSNVLRDIDFWMRFSTCAADNSRDCDSLLDPVFPQNVSEGAVCTREARDSATTRLASNAISQCAAVLRSLRSFVSLPQFAPGSIGRAVMGGGDTAGLIQVAQDTYARVTLGGRFTAREQVRMIGAGRYWQGIWAQDLVLWAMALREGAPVLSADGVPSANVIRQRLDEQLKDWRAVTADQTGKYYPERIAPGCENAIFFDLSTGAAYTRGLAHFFKRDGNAPGLRLNSPHIAIPRDADPSFMAGCNQVRPADESSLGWNFALLERGWRSVPSGTAGALGGVLAHLKETHKAFRGENPRTNPERIAVGDWRSLDDGEKYLGCYQVKLAEHFHRAGGSLVACPYIDYSSSTAAMLAKVSDTEFAMGCGSVEKGSYIDYVPRFKHWERALDSRNSNANPASSCEAHDENWGGDHTVNAYLFPGPFGKNWYQQECKWLFDCQAHRGPWKLARSWATDYSAPSGYAYDYLPHYYDRVPQEMRNTGRVKKSTPYQLLMRPMVAVPRV